MEISKAKTIKEVRRYFRPRPLNLDEIAQYHAPTLRARSKDPVTTRLELDVREYLEQGLRFHMLFAGYKGCGKSTELNVFRNNIQDDYEVISFSVVEKLDPISMDYIELIITIMDVLLEWVEENQVGKHIEQNYVDLMRNWAASKEVETLVETHTSLEAEAGAGADISWFATLFAKLRMAAKSSRSIKETLRINIEPKLSDLLFLIGSLVIEIENYLSERTGKKGLVLIVEDLDKISLERAMDLFYDHVEQLVDVKANMVYTFPISLVYNLNYNRIRSSFTDCIVLPMIKVTDMDGKPNQQGREAMVEIVQRRMDLRLFEDMKYLDQMIGYSGGCIRDLFRMIVEASMSALLNEKEKIGEEEWQSAYQSLKTDYDRTLADKIDPRTGEVVTRVQVYYQTLAELARSSDKKIPASNELMDLRQNLTVVGFNGKDWCDVHPIVKDILRDRGELKSSIGS